MSILDLIDRHLEQNPSPPDTNSPQHIPSEFTFKSSKCGWIENVLDILRTDSKCGITIKCSHHGMALFTTAKTKQVYAEAYLLVDVWDDMKCTGSYEGSFLLCNLSKRLNKTYKQMATSLCFEGGLHGSLVCTIEDYKRSTLGFTEFISDEKLQQPIQSVANYTPLFRINTQDLLIALESMPSMFTLSLNVTEGLLMFEGKEKYATTSSSISIDRKSMAALRQCVKLYTYSELCCKKSFQQVLRACRLYNYMYLGVSPGAPMMFKFLLNEAIEPTQNQPNSNCCIFISPHVTNLDSLVATQDHTKRKKLY